MKRLLLLLSLFFISTYFQAQLTYQWSSTAASTGSDVAWSTAVDPNGNVYVTGEFAGLCDFDPSAGTYTLQSNGGSKDIFLAKYNSSGVLQWAKQISGSSAERPNDIACDATGAWIVGLFAGTVDFDPSASTNNITSLGLDDIFFGKYDGSGNLVWVDRLGSNAGPINDRGLGIVVDASQNCYVTGFIGGNTDMDPGAGSVIFNVASTFNAFFGKYSSTGAYVFAKQITGSYSEGDAINIDGSGNIYLTGSYSQTNDFDPNAGTANLSTSSALQLDIYLAKYTSTGVYTYAKQIGNNLSQDIGFGVAPDASGNVYLAGVYTNNCDFDPSAGTFLLTSAGQGDLFVSKYDVNGALLWANGTGGLSNDYAYDLAIDAAGNSYITGHFNGANIDFDPSASTALLSSTGGNSGYVASYNSSGGYKFANVLNTASDGRAIAYQSPSIFVCGQFTGTVDLDFSASTATYTSAGGDDGFIAKYNVCVGSPPAQPNPISGPTSGCIGSVYTYTTNFDASATGYTWVLPSGSTGSSATNTINVTLGSNSGSITVSAYNGCGTSSVISLSVTVNPNPTVTAISNTNIICAGSSVTLTANGASTYTWSSGGTTSVTVVSPTIATTYTVNAQSAAGCNGSATIAIAVNANPTVTLALNSGTILCNGSVTSATATASGGSGFTYSWTPAGGTNSVAVGLTAGIYTVTATNACGNNSIKTINISQPTPIIVSVISNSPSICAGNSSTLTSIASGGTPIYTYSWSSGSVFNTEVVSPTVTTVYTVTVSDANGCPKSNTIAVVVNTPSVTAVSSTSLICVGQSATLTANGASTYTWSTGSSLGSIVVTPTITTNYTVVGTNTMGCTGTVVVTQSVSTCSGLTELALSRGLSVYPNPTSGNFVISLNTISPNTKVEVFNSIGELIYTESLTKKDTSVDIKNLANGVYTLKITENNVLINHTKIIKN